MAISTYTGLKAAVSDWLDRDDISSAVDDMIDAMEARLYRTLRIRFMESSLSVTIASGVAALPSDFLELRYAYIDGSPTQWLEVRDPYWIHQAYPTRSSESKPRYVAQDGDNLVFGPYPDSGYTVKGGYYAKPTALSTSNETNWLTTHAGDLLLYGTLVHSAMYLGQDPRLEVWEATYQTLLGELNQQDRQVRFSSRSPMTVSVA